MHCRHFFFYVAGLLVAFAYDDISFKKVATQSHTALSPGANAIYAVDGNTETCMKTLPIGTNSPDKTVWWKVDLGGVYSIQSIHIMFKNYINYETRQKGRLAGFSLNVSISGDVQKSTQCYKDRLKLPPLNFTTKCAEFGRYVIFYNERLDGVAYPTEYELQNVFTELCEVIVQGCKHSGFYGSNCDTPCPTNCKDSTCHIQSGVCFTCKPGWTDMHCNKTCIEGRYGLNCSLQCVGHCRDGNTCNHVTGLCDRGCDKGWRGDMCENECNEGTFGYDCVNNCSGHCLNNSPCNKQTGHCDEGCKPGYTNSDCTEECSPGYFGSNCKERCSGQCANREPCDQFSGVCHSGCGNGYIGNNCNRSCEEGHFGTNCSQVCSPNCVSDTCRPTDGLCTCAEGLTGHNCTTECILSYGDNCRYPCSLYCIKQTCDKFNGSCLHSCKYGWQCETDVENYVTVHTSSNRLPIIVGGTVGVGVGVCMFIVIGVVIKIFVKRRKSSNTKRHTNDLQSTSAAEPVVNTEGISNYQQLNFSLEENLYQSISQ